jgi:hypothetical protein
MGRFKVAAFEQGKCGKEWKGIPIADLLPEFHFFPIRIFCVHLRPIVSYFWM